MKISRRFLIVFIEAIFIGLLNVIAYTIVRSVAGASTPVVPALIASGALIHLAFEYTFSNVNLRWCRATFPCTER